MKFSNLKGLLLAVVYSISTIAISKEPIAHDRNSHEIVGRFFQCVGRCRVDRGLSFFNPSFTTAIYEGDEVQTIGESFAWIFLLDGTMVRLSPESSINFNELNIGIKENFLHTRVNTGNILWLSRTEDLFEELSVRETDVLFNPIALYEAIPETLVNQYKNLNELILKNNKFTRGKPTYAFIVMPNVTIIGYNPSVEIVSLLNGKTFFKNRSSDFLETKKDQPKIENPDIFIQMRGFENKELSKIENDKWFEVDEKGRVLEEAKENIYWLTMGEFITKHIPTLLVARELMLMKYSTFLFQEKFDPMVLATQYGYHLWGALKSEEGSKKADLELRLDFLKEYFRRIETSQLLVLSHFGTHMKERGEAIKSMKYGDYFFIKALNKYYSYDNLRVEKVNSENLNSTNKLIWKRMHGIR